jgi:5'-3' exonuclease
MSKLIVVDSGNIMHKSIFAYMNTQAVPPTYTYMRMILGYLKKIGTDLDDILILAQDFGSWRKKEDPTYKAQRKAFRESKMPEQWWKDRYEEFNKFIPLLHTSMPWNVIKIYNCEADDVASAAVRFFNADEKVLISSDRDWEMLCYFDKVKIFSPYSKKFKIVTNPTKILLEKIQGDVSDNLLKAPSSEFEFERRKKIVNLLELPLEVELTIKNELMKISPKTFYLYQLPFKSIREDVKKLYQL